MCETNSDFKTVTLTIIIHFRLPPETNTPILKNSIEQGSNEKTDTQLEGNSMQVKTILYK